MSIADGSSQRLLEDPELFALALGVEADSGRYVVAAHTRGNSELVRVQGTADGEQITRTRWTTHPETGYSIKPAAVADTLLELRMQHEFAPGLLQVARASLFRMAPSASTELIAASVAGQIPLLQTRAHVNCTVDALNGARYACVVKTRSNASDELWEIDTRTRSIRALGAEPVGYVVGTLRGPELVTTSGRLGYLRLDRRRAFYAALDDCLRHAAISRDHLAVVSGCGKESRLQLLRKPQL